MARKLNPQPAPSKPDDGADDLSILYPDVELELSGRKVTVREYGFVAGLRARARGKPLTDDLVGLVESGEAATADVEDYIDVLARHEALTRELMSESIEGADADWMDALSQDDGRTLLLTWWGVCGRFFVRLALQKLVARVMREANRMSAGSTSSPSLPGPATAAPASSDGFSRSAN